jgi:hypothetical protein
MPALPAAAEVLQVTLEGTVGDFNWVNKLHYKYSGGAPADSDLDGLVATMAANWATALAPLTDESSALTKVSCVDLTSSLSASAEDVVSEPGTRAGDFLPANACALVDYAISARYRGGHPRSYLNVGVWADLVDPAHWTDGFVGEVTTGWAILTSGIVGTTFGDATIVTLGCLSYYSGGTKTDPVRRVTPAFFTISGSTGTCQSELASQRRRIGRK